MKSSGCGAEKQRHQTDMGGAAETCSRGRSVAPQLMGTHRAVASVTPGPSKINKVKQEGVPPGNNSSVSLWFVLKLHRVFPRFTSRRKFSDVRSTTSGSTI